MKNALRILTPLLIATSCAAEPTATVEVAEPPTIAVIVSPTDAPTAVPTTSELAFRRAMAKLWEDHVAWTRMYIISAAGDLPDKDLVAARLLQNQADIGMAIAPYYGDPAGDGLTTLLEEHISGAVVLLEAAKADDAAGLEAAQTSWYANADEIAVFLNGANPDNWPLETLQTEMKNHLDVTLAEAVARLEGRHAEEIAAYDEVHLHILHLANVLSTGIVTQFPDRFEADVAVDQLALRVAMDRLWEDHVLWTRNYIVSMAGDLDDVDLVAERLLQNQTDIGDAMKAFYGDAAGDALTALLAEHIGGAVTLLAAAKAGDDAALETAQTAWYTNADEIAVFLNGANPDNWPLADLQAEMRMHLDVTLEEAVARLEGRHEDDIAAYDKVHTHILALSDVLSTGIIAQFPDQFE